MADVEVVRRLVEEDDVGVLGEDHGNEGALALAADISSMKRSAKASRPM